MGAYNHNTIIHAHYVYQKYSVVGVLHDTFFSIVLNMNESIETRMEKRTEVEWQSCRCDNV